MAPTNQIPPEILALIPDFWDTHDGDKDLIALTHVCRAWREVFTSRSSLWTDLDCADGDKAHVYLERSKSSPINLSVRRNGDLSPSDPFFQIIPHVIGRLKSLSVRFWKAPGTLQDITAHLSRPAPLLEKLLIHGGYYGRNRNVVLPSTLFNGELSSLRTLDLQSIRTGLPWRNMINLTSFTLAYASPCKLSIGQFLDFIESAPRLRIVHLRFATLTHDAQYGRLVSPAHLKEIVISGRGPPSLLLNHLVIPVGAELITQVEFDAPVIEDHLPKSLDNLRNFSDFTTIELCGNNVRP